MQNTKNKYKSIVITAFVIFLLYIIIILVSGKVFYTNNTKSAERGIYMWIPSFSITKGNMMTVSLPRAYGNFEKGHLLLKFIRGVPGDEYVITDDFLKIDGVEYPFVKDKRVPKLKSGTYKIPEGKYLALNDVHDSFDGRYFGLVDEKDVHKRVVMFLNFEDINSSYLAFQKFDSTIWIKDKMRELWKK